MVQRTQSLSVDQLKLSFDSKVLFAAAVEVLSRWDAVDELPKLKIVWNGRLRTSGGRALLHQQQVELNPRLIAQNPQYFSMVLIHELAHLITTARHGRVKPHGREWQQLMIAAGENPTVRHSMDASAFYSPRRRRAPSGIKLLRRIFKSMIK